MSPLSALLKKQIIVETPNLVFYNCIICRWYLKLFMKIRQIVCVRVHTKGFEYIMACGRNFLLVHLIHLDCTKCNETNIHFFHAQKHVTCRIWCEYHSYFVDGDTQKVFGYICDNGWKRLKVHFMLFYAIFK